MTQQAIVEGAVATGAVVKDGAPAPSKGAYDPNAAPAKSGNGKIAMGHTGPKDRTRAEAARSAALEELEKGLPDDEEDDGSPIVPAAKDKAKAAAPEKPKDDADEDDDVPPGGEPEAKPEPTEEAIAQKDGVALLKKIKRKQAAHDEHVRGFAAEKEHLTKTAAAYAELKQLAESDPEAALERLGIPFERLVDNAIKRNTPEEAARRAARAELEAERKKGEDAKQKTAEQARKAYEEVHTDFAKYLSGSGKYAALDMYGRTHGGVALRRSVDGAADALRAKGEAVTFEGIASLLDAEARPHMQKFLSDAGQKLGVNGHGPSAKPDLRADQETVTPSEAAAPRAPTPKTLTTGMRADGSSPRKESRTEMLKRLAREMPGLRLSDTRSDTE